MNRSFVGMGTKRSSRRVKTSASRIRCSLTQRSCRSAIKTGDGTVGVRPLLLLRKQMVSSLLSVMSLVKRFLVRLRVSLVFYVELQVFCGKVTRIFLETQRVSVMSACSFEVPFCDTRLGLAIINSFMARTWTTTQSLRNFMTLSSICFWICALY